jgi:hypothetical protein
MKILSSAPLIGQLDTPANIKAQIRQSPSSFNQNLQDITPKIGLASVQREGMLNNWVNNWV